MRKIYLAKTHHTRKTGKTYFGNTHINTLVMLQDKSKLQPLLRYEEKLIWGEVTA
jgi:hypothetical protein